MFYGRDPIDHPRPGLPRRISYQAGYLDGLHNIKEIHGHPSWYMALNHQGQLICQDNVGRRAKLNPSWVASTRFVSLATVNISSLAADTHGQVWSWKGDADDKIQDPKLIDNLRDIVLIKMKWTTTLALDRHGRVWHSGTHKLDFKLIDQLGGIVSLDCGRNHVTLQDHAALVDKKGRVYEWSYNRLIQTRLEDIKQVYCGGDYTMAVSNQGHVWCWGNNDHGQLGLGDYTKRSSPQRIIALNGVVIKKLFCGYSHCIATNARGEYWGWGLNTMNQLNLTNLVSQPIPVRIPKLTPTGITNKQTSLPPKKTRS
jgi:alpha-tubulin suppressor-like RCC1 family protein